MVALRDEKLNALIREIASNLDCGIDCYYNPKTTELISIPHDLDDYDFQSKGFFEDDLKKIHEKPEGYLKFEVPTSFESFKIMEKFLDEVDDVLFRERLIQALSKRKPFQNFKYLIDYSNYRNKWFDFKGKKVEELVRKQSDQK